MSRPPKERTLALARTMSRATTDPQIRVYAFRKLVTRPLTLMSLQAMLSCLLNKVSPLKAEAKDFLQKISSKNSREILAVAFFMATRSQETYERVAVEVVAGGLELGVTSGDMQVWRELGQKSWVEIRELLGACSLDPMPSDAPTLRLCRWVMEGPIADDIPAILQELLGLHDLSSLGFLRRIMVATAVMWRDASLIDMLRPHAVALSKEIKPVLVAFGMPRLDLDGFELLATGNVAQHVCNLVQLADIYVEHLESHTDVDVRRSEARQLIETGCLRVLPTHAQMWKICQLAGNPRHAMTAVISWEKYCVYSPDRQDPSGMSTEQRESADRHNAFCLAVGDASARVFQAMPPELQAETLAKLLELTTSRSFDSQVKRFVPEYRLGLENIHEIPAHIQQVLRAFIRAGGPNASVLDRYVRYASGEVRHERLSDLEQWLLHRNLDAGHDYKSSLTLFTEVAIRHNLKRGCLLSNLAGDASYHGWQGYELTAEDIAASGVWRNLLPREEKNGDFVYRWSYYWKFASFRMFLFTLVDRADEIVASYLATLDNCDGTEYDEHLAPFIDACAREEAFRSELLLYATNEKGDASSQRAARQAIVSGSKAEWFSPSSRASLREYFAKDMTCLERESADVPKAIFGLDGLRELFLQSPNPWMLKKQKAEWVQVFRETGKDIFARFRKKLATSAPLPGSTHIKNWLEWVEAVGLHEDPTFRSRIERFALDCPYDSNRYEQRQVLELALKLVGYTPRDSVSG